MVPKTSTQSARVAAVLRTVCEDLSVGPNSLQPCPSPAASRCCDGGRATVTMRLAHSLRAVPSGSISSTPCKKERNRHSLYMPRRGARGFSSCYILELLLLCSLLDKINHSQPRRAETFANSETASELETMRRNQNAEGIFSFHAVFFTGQHWVLSTCFGVVRSSLQTVPGACIRGRT